MKRTKFAIESEKYAKENPFVGRPQVEERPEILTIEALQANITEIMANKAELARENEELKKVLKEAFYLIENIGWTSVEQPEVISRAEKWLQSFPAL